MGIISDVITQVDLLLLTHIQDVFNIVSTPLKATLAIAGGLSLMFVAINHIYNVRQVSYSTYVTWAARYVCIVAFATVWANFNYVRELIVDTPIQYATATIVNVKKVETEKYVCGRVKGPLNLITWVNVYCTRTITTTTPLVAGTNSINEIMDTFSGRIFDISGDLFDKVTVRPRTYKYLVSGFVVAVIGVVFSAVAVFILLMAKIGLTMMFAMGPLAIAMLTFQQTRGYFEKWLSLTVGFALVPLIVVGLMSIVLNVSSNLATTGDGFFGPHLAFVLIAVAALAFLFEVPNLASTLAGASLPRMGGGAMAGAAGSIGKMASAPFAAASKPFAAAAAIGNRMAAAKGASQVAGAKGRGPVAQAYAGAKAMMQSSQYRAEKASRKFNQDGLMRLAKGQNPNTSTPNTQRPPAASYSANPAANNTPAAPSANAPAPNTTGGNAPAPTSAARDMKQNADYRANTANAAQRPNPSGSAEPNAASSSGAGTKSAMGRPARSVFSRAKSRTRAASKPPRGRTP